MEECLYHIPESLQGSERYEAAESAVDNLQSATQDLESVIEYITAAAE